MSRHFAPITPGDLQRKFIAQFKSVHDFLYGNSLARQDLCKVEFDGENWSENADDSPHVLKSIMGFNTLDNGLTYWGMTAGGDWEHPVYFIIYWDGKDLRGYVPKDGNVYNFKTKSAWGNHGTSYEDAPNDFDPKKIVNDIQARIQLKTDKPSKVQPSDKKSLVGFTNEELLDEIQRRLNLLKTVK